MNQAVRLQDRARLPFQGREQDVVIGQSPGLRRDRRPPVVHRLEHIQEDASSLPPVPELEHQVPIGRRPRLHVGLVLLVTALQRPDRRRQVMSGRVQPLLQVRPVSQDDQVLLADAGSPLPQAERDRERDPDRPVGELTRIGREPCPERRQPAGKPVPPIQGGCVQLGRVVFAA